MLATNVCQIPNALKMRSSFTYQNLLVGRGPNPMSGLIKCVYKNYKNQSKVGFGRLGCASSLNSGLKAILNA